MDGLVGRIANAINRDPQLLSEIGDYLIDIHADPIEGLGKLVTGADEATQVLLSGAATAVTAAAIEQLGLRERFQQGTINLYNNTRDRITHGANSLRERWQNRRNQPVRANVAYMVGGKKSKRKHKKSKRKHKKSKRRRRKSR